MNKRIIDAAIVLTVFMGLAGTAMAVPVPNNIPDAGASSMLLGLAVSGLMVVRRWVK